MKFQLATIVLASGLFLSSCGGEEKPTTQPSSESENPIEETQEEVILTGDLAIKGVGPIKSLKLEEVDKYLAESGKDLFKTNCTACHKFSDRHIGPALSGIMDRRSPEWIMN
ncbi:MAG: c-type cytochrome, partial [Crocinitomicaceae bacterium]